MISAALLERVACPVCLEPAGCAGCARPAGHATCAEYAARARCACGGPDKVPLRREASVLRFRPIPVIVGVSALVHPEVHFGTLAVLPNHAELGVQAANLIFDLSDNGWVLEEERRVEMPLRVMTVVDVNQVDDYFGLKADALAKIDRAVE